jgi:hypothetical protein
MGLCRREVTTALSTADPARRARVLLLAHQHELDLPGRGPVG